MVADSRGASIGDLVVPAMAWTILAAAASQLWRSRRDASLLIGGVAAGLAWLFGVSDWSWLFASQLPTGLDPAIARGVLRLFESLHEAGQTLVVVTHDERIAATADRLISMRDGAFVDETRLTGGTTGQLGALAGLEG